MTAQQFHRLDVVRIAPQMMRRVMMEQGTGRTPSEEVVPSPSREDDQEVIILGCYNDLYGGNADTSRPIP